ncbi:MAG: PBSX family phage terminase large subunit [Oscillospiraceae bacterium]|jgi:PBSX family phage terminase large subunit|nr:PBSX family phage terminase large subunit [Oscillospiraceae bacterium]
MKFQSFGSFKAFRQFSPKQKKVFRWWCGSERNHDAIICDGAVRSGKTMCMSLSFVFWATALFNNRAFAICSKTIKSAQRNIVEPMLPQLRNMGFRCDEKTGKAYFDASFFGHKNRFYLFGGKDEGSAALIQGMTLGGVLLDEVALMPRSFVEQAIARCSLAGSKLWFNCNPEHPAHWFHEEWIKKAGEKRALYLHFTMRDNPSLSPAILERYRNLYSGAFYQRFVEGKWTAAEGLVYPMFSAQGHVVRELPGSFSRFIISCDYGTVNPASFGLWGLDGGCWYRLREYYWDSRLRGAQRTDEEHYRALEELAGGLPVERVICDPSAASFIECVRRHGAFFCVPARNDVLDGIRKVADALREDRLKFHESCKDCIREFGQYLWESGGGRDAPRKEHDHAMDDVRYFVSTALRAENGGSFFAGAIRRG